MCATLLSCCLLDCLCHFPDDFGPDSSPEEEFLDDVLRDVVCSHKASPELMFNKVGRLFCCAKPPPADFEFCATNYCC